MLIDIFILLAAFQVKHFLSDYILQNSYMFGKFRKGWEFLPPLLAHCSVHALFTLIIVAAYGWNSLTFFWICMLPVIDASVHFIMDRIKAAPHYWGRYQIASPREISQLRNTKILNRKERRVAGAKIKMPGHQTRVNRTAALKQAEQMLKSNKLFWWCLGFDQMVHHLTHYLVIYLLLTL